MQKPCFVGVLFVVACLSIASFAKTGEEDRRRGYKDFSEHNYQKALADFQKAIAGDEEYDRKHHRDATKASNFAAPYLAITYAKLGEFEKAFESWKSYFGAQPLPPDAPQVDARISDPDLRYCVQRLAIWISGTPSHPRERTYHFNWPYYYGLADLLRHAGLNDSADKVENEGRIFLEATVAGDKAAGWSGGDGASAARVRVYQAENRPQYAEDERASEAEVRQAEADYQAEHPYQPSTLDLIIAGLSGANPSGVARGTNPAPADDSARSASASTTSTTPPAMNSAGQGQTPARLQNDCLRIVGTHWDRYRKCEPSGNPAFYVDAQNACSVPIVFRICGQQTSGGWQCGNGAAIASTDTFTAIIVCPSANAKYEWWAIPNGNDWDLPKGTPQN